MTTLSLAGDPWRPHSLPDRSRDASLIPSNRADSERIRSYRDFELELW